MHSCHLRLSLQDLRSSTFQRGLETGLSGTLLRSLFRNLRFELSCLRTASGRQVRGWVRWPWIWTFDLDLIVFGLASGPTSGRGGRGPGNERERTFLFSNEKAKKNKKKATRKRILAREISICSSISVYCLNFILNTDLIPSSVSTMNLQSNQPFSCTNSDGPSPGFGRKGFTNLFKGDNNTKTEIPVRTKDLKALNQLL